MGIIGVGTRGHRSGRWGLVRGLKRLSGDLKLPI